MESLKRKSLLRGASLKRPVKFGVSEDYSSPTVNVSSFLPSFSLP
jgi:hypothetical protein